MSTRTKAAEVELYDHEARLSEVAAAREAVAEAKRTVAARQVAWESTRSHLDDVRAALARGDSDVDASTLTDAEAGVRAAELAAQGAEKAVARAKRRVPYTEELAAALAVVLSETRGVEAFHVIGSGDTVPGGAMPAFLVRQDGPGELSRRGTLSGVVKASYVHSALHSRPDADAITARLRKADVRADVRVGRTRTVDGAEVTDLTFRVGYLLPRPLWLPRGIDEIVVTHLGSDIAGRAVENSTPRGSTWSPPTMRARGDSKLVSTRVTDGVRRTVVEVEIGAWSKFNSLAGTSYWTTNGLVERVRAELLSLEGTGRAGLGHVVDVDIVQAGHAERGIGVTGRITYESV